MNPAAIILFGSLLIVFSAFMAVLAFAFVLILNDWFTDIIRRAKF